jgi:transposase
MANEEKIQIRIDLEGDVADKFNAIKSDRGLENNTDVIRLLITEAFKRLSKEV